MAKKYLIKAYVLQQAETFQLYHLGWALFEEPVESVYRIRVPFPFKESSTKTLEAGSIIF